MSMILDALRKSDRQRARQAAERLREGPPLANPASLHGHIVAFIAAGILLALVALAVAIWSKDRRPASDAGHTVAGITVNIPAPVRPLDGELVKERADEVAAVDAAPRTLAPAPVESLTRTEIVDNLAAPPLSALPALRLRLPELRLDIHAWAQNPAARFVLINLRRYHEGDRLQEGPIVRRILRTGVVLEFEGTLFTLPRQ